MLIAAAMDEAAKSAWCRLNGIHLHDLVAWRQCAIDALCDSKPAAAAVSQLQGQAKEDRLCIQELERDLISADFAAALRATVLVTALLAMVVVQLPFFELRSV